LAATAAQRAIEMGFADRALVDAFSVLMQVRPNGQRRYVSAGFNRKDRYLVEPFAPGVYLTQAALDLVPQLEGTSIPSTDLHQLVQAEQRELTSVGAVRHSFVGRDSELNQLFVSAAQSAVKNIPTIATITGEGGLGKSELAGALASGLTQKIPQGEVFAFRCQEGMDGGQSRNIADLLRWGLGINRDLPLGEGRALLAKAFGLAPEDLSWAPAALALGWIQLDHPDLKELLSAPGALRAAIARTMGEALRLASKRQPVMIVADDAHLADETLLDGLEYATLKEADAAVWVCLLTRPSLLVGRPLLGARAAANPVQELTPMLTEDAVRLARILLEPAENIPVAALQKLVSRTQGNPLLLVELVRSLKREGAIKQSSKGEFRLEVEAIDKLPDSPVVQWLATREIEALPPELAGHARMAAILGSDLSDVELEGVIVLAEEEGTAIETQLDAMVGLRRLVDANILVRHRSGRFSFRYGVLRDATYGLVPEATRTSIHALAYRFYSTSSKDSEEERLPRLAFHSARAGMKSEAASLFLDLAGKARKRHAYLEASNLYAQARAQIEASDGSRLVRVMSAHALMLFRIGNFDRSLAGLREAQTLAQQINDKAAEFEIVLEMATVADFLQEIALQRDLAVSAEALIPNREDVFANARLLLTNARVLWRSGSVGESIPVFKQSIELSSTLGDEGYETRIDAMALLGASLSAKGHLDEGLEVFDELLKICARTNDRLHEVAVLLNRVFVWLPRGNYEKVRLESERALVIARENCFGSLECMITNNLGEVSLLAGDWASAERYAAEGLALFDRMSGVSMYTALQSLLVRARAKILSGDKAAAKSLLSELENRIAAVKAAGAEFVIMPSDAVLCDAVEFAVRDASDEEWADLLKRADEHSVQLEPMEVYAIRGLSAFRRGANGTALAAFDKALALAEVTLTPMKPQIVAWRQDVLSTSA
jgi:eukaryotic-like serine/threonine-protein kinase